MPAHDRPSRRLVLRSGVAAATSVATAAVAGPDGALGSPTTPAQLEGPYYPAAELLRRRYPRHQDNDLCTADVEATVAQGVQVYLAGTLRTARGAPVAGAELQIWQTCHRGRYLHPADDWGSEIPVDPGFQYFGRCLSGDDGGYAFRTVMPRRYPSGGQREWWRPPHVHWKVLVEGRERLTTQMYFDDPYDPDNEWRHRAAQAADRILARLPAGRRADVVVPLTIAEEVVGLEELLARSGLRLDLDAATRTWGPPRAGRFDLTIA